MQFTLTIVDSSNLGCSRSLNGGVEDEAEPGGADRCRPIPWAQAKSPCCNSDRGGGLHW